MSTPATLLMKYGNLYLYLTLIIRNMCAMHSGTVYITAVASEASVVCRAQTSLHREKPAIVRIQLLQLLMRVLQSYPADWSRTR